MKRVVLRLRRRTVEILFKRRLAFENKKSSIRRCFIAYTTVTTANGLINAFGTMLERNLFRSLRRTYTDICACVHGRRAGYIIIVLAFCGVYATTIQTARFASDFRERCAADPSARNGHDRREVRCFFFRHHFFFLFCFVSKLFETSRKIPADRIMRLRNINFIIFMYLPLHALDSSSLLLFVCTVTVTGVVAMVCNRRPVVEPAPRRCGREFL